MRSTAARGEDWSESHFDRHLRLFRRGELVYTADPAVLVLLPLLLVTFAAAVFPYFHSQLGTAAHWGMAVLTVAGIVGSLFAHEAVHVSVAHALGEHPHGLFLYLFGAAVPTEAPRAGRWGRILMSVAGIGVSAFLGILFLTLAYLSDTNARPDYVTGIFFHLALANVSLAVLQCLPALPLDGGRGLLDLLSRDATPSRKLVGRLFALGNGIAAGLAAFGGYHLANGFPIWGAWSLVLSLLVARANYVEYKYLCLRSAIAGHAVRDFMSPDAASVPASASLADLALQFGRHRSFRCFPVVSDGCLVGIARVSDLYRFPREEWRERIVLDILSTSTPDNTVAPGTDAAEALSLMFHTGNARLLVRDGKRLAGIVSYGDLVEGAATEMVSAALSRAAS